MQAINRPANLGELVYKNEKTLFTLHFALATVFWLLLIVGTMGMALLYMFALFISYLFAAIAIPAYHDYTKRIQQTQSVQMPNSLNFNN